MSAQHTGDTTEATGNVRDAALPGALVNGSGEAPQSRNGSGPPSADQAEELRLAREGIELTRKQTANAWWQTGILVLTLGAALWTIRDGRRAINRQLRAYLFLDTFHLRDGATLMPPQPQHANHPSIFISMKNSGETPAYDVFSDARIEVRPMYEENILPVLAPATISKTYVPRDGGITKTLFLGRNLAPQELAGLNAGTHAIYLIGRIDYRDAFLKPRFTTYRLRYSGTYPPLGAQTMSFCDGGNDAD